MKRLIALAVTALMVLSACSSGDGERLVQAKFDDVGDLFPLAPVTFADIRVGEVKDIRLSGTQALVVIELNDDADIPANVSARIRRTSVLGERIIDLVVPEGETAATASLSDGATIADTETRPDLENLVTEGNDVLGVVGASQIATMVNEGARGFGGNGEELRDILINFRDITKTFSKNSDSITGLIRSLDEFNSGVAEKADDHARAVGNTARALRVLDEESDELAAALQSLARLAKGSRSLMDAHIDEMERFFEQSRIILGALAAEQNSIVKLLAWAPRHHRNTQLVEYLDFNQVIQEFVICGFNDNPDDPARRCPGESR